MRLTLRKAPGAVLLLTAPALLAYVGFVFIPVLLTIFYSLTDWDGFSPSYDFTWLENYRTALDDEVFRHALWVTLEIAASATVLLTIAGIGLAVLLNRRDRITRAYQAIFFLPIILSPIVSGFLFQTVFTYDGIGNSLLGSVGIAPVDFLGDAHWALATIVVVTVWQTAGFTMVLYLAALQTIPRELNEAAALDGAGPFRTFRHVTLPLLAPALTVNTVLLLIFFMRIYEYVVVVTGGGPAGQTQTLAYRVVQEGVNDNRFAYGCTLAVVLLVLIAILALAIGRLLSLRERRVA